MRKKNIGNTDEREKSRKLTEAEQRRLDAFEEMAEERIRRGYERVDLTVSLRRANVFGVILLIPLLMGSMLLFFLLHEDVTGFRAGTMVLFLVLFAVLIVVHELIHGITWALFAEHHWKDIRFGFIREYLTPYCTCTVPLKRGEYIVGALMPMLLLGILPLLAGLLGGWWLPVLLGVAMTDAAAGDLLIVWDLLRYRSGREEIVYMDHPTQAGGVIFQR